MTNERLIYEAIERAAAYCEQKNIANNTNSLGNRILTWYNNTDITDADTLAALALEFTTFENLPMSIIEAVTESYFPKCSVYDEDDTYFERW